MSEQDLSYQAEILLDLRRYPDATKLIARALASDPQLAEHHFQMARALAGQSEWVKAKEFCMSGLGNEPNSAVGFYILSFVEHHLRDFDAELQAAERAAELDPEAGFALDRLARAQLQSGMLRDARASATQLVALEPESADAHELLADLCLEVNDGKAAEMHVREALRYAPENAGLINDLARAQMAQKNFRDAVDTLLSALKIDPGSETLAQNLYHCVDEHVGSALTPEMRRQRLAELPIVAQQYNQFRRDRRGLLQKPWVVAGSWLLALVLLVVGISMMTA